MKKYLCGLAVLAALSAPISAEELYVRNRAFGDAYFVGGTTYVPAGAFLKALDVAWTDSGASVTLGSGDSPESAFDNESVSLSHGGKTLDLTGMLRGGKLYLPAKALANFVGYTVINNPDTGIVDVVKSREYTAADSAAEKEVAAAEQAAKEAPRPSGKPARPRRKPWPKPKPRRKPKPRERPKARKAKARLKPPAKAKRARKKARARRAEVKRPLPRVRKAKAKRPPPRASQPRSQRNLPKRSPKSRPKLTLSC
jgi:pyruvate/2-oxoglutarate dehydrogenase complex dihydrolipoamide acyltransferase (E2) component